MVKLTESDFGELNKVAVKKFTWTTNGGLTVSVISYGAIIQEIKVPDKNGEAVDVVLGFDDLEGYVEKNTNYFGATIGRCANRIAGGQFQLDGITYNVAKNIGKNHLHGGVVGFDKVIWNSTVNGNKVIFSYLSKDLEEGYPGDLIVNVTYEITEDNTIHIDFLATTTKKTIVNLTNHSYFNLAGHDAGAEELYEHFIIINADKITETDSDSIPTGRFSGVGGTLYDLRSATRIGGVLDKDSKLFDDNYCIKNHGHQDIITFVSRVSHPSSGRILEVHSDQPGVQFYTGNFLPAPSDTALTGKSGKGYRRQGGFCLETQNYPDAINHKNFPSPILVPGSVYKHSVTYRFLVGRKSDPVVVPA